ncbi:ketopantoate reductase family protein [Bordetella bronchialis]|uniref:2-dehydropantoate 2-reductase n=1 Tax=Bordetella bronchialis TaxID=463025 RepID=A0A193FE53_9BORD|nr:ketopantoate reductase family protein [Bordetella bronchialis]ANN65429.1 hypothetical protein BAU06_03175 [Bordetella bronchialis]ANN70459.1 hypothetical protein BAU08_03140 [Bordetella bronchialis]
MRRILIVGCGAMGGIFAAHLQQLADVTVLDVNAAHVEAIRANGLRVEGPQPRTVRLRAAMSADEVAGESFDAVIFLTKSGQTAAAWSALRPVLRGTPLLVTLQNGMGNSETLQDGSDFPVARGVTLDAGRFLGPGQVEHLIRGNTTWIGPMRGTVEDCAWLARLLGDAGMPSQAIEDPMDAVWSKFVFNAVMNPVGALLLGVNRARYDVPQVRDLIDDLARECTDVVAALGGRLAFDPMQLVKQTRAGERPITRHAGSMALDIARGAATEIDELTGYVVREGDRLGVDVTACRTVYRLVKGLELARAVQLREQAGNARP